MAFTINDAYYWDLVICLRDSGREPMKISVYARSYRSAGGGPFQLAGTLLEMGAPDLGKGLEKIEIRVCFSSDPGCIPRSYGFAESYDAFEAHCRSLPSLELTRNGTRVELEYHSHVCKAEDYEVPYPEYPEMPAEVMAALAKASARQDFERILKDNPMPMPMPMPSFQQAPELSAKQLDAFFSELVDVLVNCRSQLAAVEDFNVDAFLQWAIDRKAQMPKTDAAVKKIAEAASQFHAKQRANADEWEIVDVDWSLYHPSAKALLNDPFFWSCSDELSPHGNDEGADLIAFFSNWRYDNPNGSSRQFFDEYVDSWGFEDHEHFLFKSTYAYSVIGMAFAHIKFDGICPAWARDEALTAVERLIACPDDFGDAQELISCSLQKLKQALLNAPLMK
jgi:uncharacterized protein YfeS